VKSEGLYIFNFMEIH